MTGLDILDCLRKAAEGNRLSVETAGQLHAEQNSLENLPSGAALPDLTAILCGIKAGSVLREFGEVLAVLLPELRPMFGFQQHNPHHDRDVWEHTIAVVEAAPSEPILRWAALLHDVGKPRCFAILEDGLGHFYGHAQVSQQMAEKILTRLGMEEAERTQVCELIRYHDFPIPPEKKRLAKLVRKHGEETVRQLIQLHLADTRGQSELCAGRIAEYTEVAAVLEEYLEEERTPVFTLAVNGHEVMALGFQGREIGTVLEACRERVLSGDLPNEKTVLIPWIQRHFKPET